MCKTVEAFMLTRTGNKGQLVHVHVQCAKDSRLLTMVFQHRIQLQISVIVLLSIITTHFTQGVNQHIHMLYIMSDLAHSGIIIIIFIIITLF